MTINTTQKAPQQTSKQEIKAIKKAEAKTILNEQAAWATAREETMIETTLERAQEEVDRLSAWPAVVDVMHEHEFRFLQEMQHWIQKGYRLGTHSLQTFAPGAYYVLMFAPTR